MKVVQLPFLYNNMKLRIILVLLIFKEILSAATGFTVSISDPKINAVTSYTWLISFTDTSARSTMTFTFPTGVTISSSTSATFGSGSSIAPTSNTSNSVTFSTTSVPITSLLNVVISNVINPFSALSSQTTFFYSSNIDSPLTLTPIDSKSYTPGTLKNCTWTFNKCTEQYNSLMTVTLTTSNQYPAGNRQIFLGYPSSWANLNQKSLTSGGFTLACSIKINNGANITSGVTCSSTSTLMTVNFNLPISISGNDTIYVYIQGVLSPPTVNTPSSNLYTAKTGDGAGSNIEVLPSGAFCYIQPVCLTNYSVGVITPLNIPIHFELSSLKTNFNIFPTISFYYQDTVEVYNTFPTVFVGCSKLKIVRNSKLYQLGSVSTGALMAFSFSTSTNLPNQDYNFAIQASIQCTKITAPPSEAPVVLSYKFKRNGQYYLQLNSTLNAVATLFNPVKGSLVLSNYEMGATGVEYTFSFTLSQPLSESCSFTLTFPTQISLTSTTCKLALNNGLESTAACTHSSTVLSLNYTSPSNTQFSIGDNFTIKVSGLANPLLPQTFNFGLKTFYSSILSTSLVEYNSIAFSALYTVITNLQVTLSPSVFTSYTLSSTTISFTTPLNIPALSDFTVIIPSNLTQFTAPIQPLLIDGSQVLLQSNPSIQNSTILTFSNTNSIGIGKVVSIQISFFSPTILGNYPSIKLYIIKSNISYIASLNSMPVNVNAVSQMPVSISPDISTTGAISPYTITLTLTIPHGLFFNIRVDIASDTLIQSGLACLNLCSAVIIGTNSFTATVTNPYPDSVSSQNIDIKVSNIKNSRNIGPGLPWNITTYTTANQTISFQSAFPTISIPNSLIGILDTSSEYYRSNGNIVKFKLNFSNWLISSDYILLTMERITYDVNSTISCSSFYGVCQLDAASTSNLLIIRITPNLTNVFTNPFDLWVSGLVSGANTAYLQIDYITVGSYNFNGNLIDQGKIQYRIDCRDTITLPKNCRTCLSSSCTSCYTTQGYFLNGSSCVTSCGTSSDYMQYGVSGVCVSCANVITGCSTCINATACLTCLNSSYYLFPSTMTCSIFCQTTAGFISTVISDILVCLPCPDAGCLQCTNTSYGFCTKCSPPAVLAQGLCLSGCPSLAYYPSITGQCVPCHTSCHSCTNAGNNSCIICAIGFYNSSGICTNSCPSGSAIIVSTGTCGCLPSCLTCASNNYANCTACLNTTQFVYFGQCVSSCPPSTIKNNLTCVSCETGCLSCSITFCLVCDTNWIIYDGHCYGDCNSISRQYDKVGSTCILCPSGCDTCSGSTCTTCLSGYSFLSGQCVLTCEIDNTCQINTSEIIPLPGTLTLVIWFAIVMIVKYNHPSSQKTVVAYSAVFIGCVIELVLAFSIAINANSQISRLLLTAKQSSRSNIVGLVGAAIALNYLFSLIYLYIYCKYIKPLVGQKQSDKITNTIVLVIGCVTNLRFALFSFAKFCQKPNIPIPLQKYLTPVHYVVGFSTLTSLFYLAVGIIGVMNEQQLTLLYMLCLDLLLITIFNTLLTFIGICSNKHDEYFKDENQKNYKQESVDMNVTKQNLDVKNEKDQSKINMVAIQSISDETDKNSQDNINYIGQDYKKMNPKRSKINLAHQQTAIIRMKSNQSKFDQAKSKQEIKSNQKIQKFNIFSIQNEYIRQQQPIKDINFQEIISNKRIKSNQLSRSTTAHKIYKQMQEDSLPSKSFEFNQRRFQKQLQNAKFNQIKQEHIVNQVDDGLQSLGEKSIHHFDSKLSTLNGFKKQRPNHVNEFTNKTSMKKNKNKRIMEINADSLERQEKQSDYQDLAEIIRNKVQQSSFRKTQNLTFVSDDTNDLQEISPSYYNIQNQRFEIEDIQGTPQSQS